MATGKAFSVQAKYMMIAPAELKGIINGNTGIHYLQRYFTKHTDAVTHPALSYQLPHQSLHRLDFDTVDEVIGGYGIDFIYGNDEDNRIFGVFGRDRLFGNGGDDFLSSGFEARLIDGGTGDDVLYRDWARDGVVSVYWTNPVGKRITILGEGTTSGGEKYTYYKGIFQLNKIELKGGEGLDTLILGDYPENGSPYIFFKEKTWLTIIDYIRQHNGHNPYKKVIRTSEGYKDFKLFLAKVHADLESNSYEENYKYEYKSYGSGGVANFPSLSTKGTPIP